MLVKTSAFRKIQFAFDMENSLRKFKFRNLWSYSAT